MGFMSSVLEGFGVDERRQVNKTVIRPKRQNQKPKIRYENFNLHDKKENNHMQMNVNNYASGATSNLVIYAPSSHKDVQDIVESLKKAQGCLVNLDQIDNNDVHRTLDFLSGAVFALNGKINRVQGDLFLITPVNVSIKRA
jgi:cell division inhibitor SepF